MKHRECLFAHFPYEYNGGHKWNTVGFQTWATNNPDTGADIIFCFDQYVTISIPFLNS